MTKKFLLTETLSDTIVTYIVLKKLTKPWEEWDAYKLGIIDDKGNKIKHPTSSDEMKAWTILDRFIWNLKKIMIKFVGQSKLASMLTALYLLKNSVDFYCKHNQQLLVDDCDMEDFTYEKQLKLHKLLKEMENVYILNESTDNIEFSMLKYAPKVEKILNELEITTVEDLL